MKLFPRFISILTLLALIFAAPGTLFSVRAAPSASPSCTVSGALRSFTLAQSLPPTDDGSSTTAIPLGFTINYFGADYSTVWVNNNGNVTFGDKLPSYTPAGMGGVAYKTLAPFFADVDTRGQGLVSFDQVTVGGRPAFAVNWHNVGYYKRHSDKLNDFQLVIIERSDRGAGDWDFEYNYAQIQWETGDASGGLFGLGGTSAGVGYSDGDAGTNDWQLAGSLTPGSFLDSNSTTGLVNTALNSTVCGRRVTPVDGGVPFGFHFITGSLTSSGSEAKVAYNGGAITADGSGNYSITVDDGWEGTITPSKTGFIFSPTSITVSIPVTADLPNQNFTATPVPAITNINPNVGRMLGGTTVVISGVHLSGGNVFFGGTAATCIVDSDIQITCTTPAHISGAVTVVVSIPGGGTTSVIGGFTYYPYIVSGNAGVAGASLSYTDVTLKTVTAGADGNYALGVSDNWTGTVIPSKAGYVFTPASKSYANVMQDQTNQDYTASPGAAIDVYIGTSASPVGSYQLKTSESARVNYAGVNNGPLKITSTNGTPIIAALRDAWQANGVWTSFAQLMGLPVSQVSDTYYFPAYNNISLDEQLRFGNVGTADTTVTVTIGGLVKGSYFLHPGESARVNYAGVNSGPVIAQSSGGVDIIAAERDAWQWNGVWYSFVQLMGLPASQLSDTYYFPAYNNISLDEQLRFGNVGTADTTVTVTIGGQVKGSYFLHPNQSARVNYAGVNSGPVVVQSSDGVPIIVAERDAWQTNGVWTSFAQTMGLPVSQVSDTYVFPAYNNISLDEQLRFGNVGTADTTVTVTIGGQPMGSYFLHPSESARVNYAGVNSGPVVVKSSGNVAIIAAERDAWQWNGVWYSFVQTMGLPAGQLSDTYVFPAYNNISLDEQLRFGVP